MSTFPELIPNFRVKEVKEVSLLDTALNPTNGISCLRRSSSYLFFSFESIKLTLRGAYVDLVFHSHQAGCQDGLC